MDDNTAGRQVSVNTPQVAPDYELVYIRQAALQNAIDIAKIRSTGTYTQEVISDAQLFLNFAFGLAPNTK